MDRRTRTRVMAAFLALVLILGLVGGALASIGGSSGDSGSGSTGSADTTLGLFDPTLTEDGAEAPTDTLPRHSDLPTISVFDLPEEGKDTLRLIAAGGPYPYDRDGVTFENREGILPDEPLGYYAEYTVPTPGESDRGARRLVVGEQREVYYTDDHYDSFREVVVD